MASEDRCDAPTLCVNGCGFFGTPATLNLCSKCYRDLDPDGTLSRSLSKLKISSPAEEGVESGPSSSSGGGGPGGGDGATKRLCGLCNRKLRLLSGFKCRCGGTYCMGHRLQEKHTCMFDFKAVGRDALAKANPLVKPDKLAHRI